MTTSFREERIRKLALGFGRTPGHHVAIVTGFGKIPTCWWLIGCIEGDFVLPVTKATNIDEVIEKSEAWLRFHF